MMTGTVTPDREAVIDLQVQDAAGSLTSIRAVLDTGFNGYLTLPMSRISNLSLPLQGTRDALLADGSTVRLDISRAIVIWDSRPRPIQILAAEGDPLVGMSLLYGYAVLIKVIDGGDVEITALP
jgi:clan AA aspartic protease